jgi:hypothetical protein
MHPPQPSIERIGIDPTPPTHITTILHPDPHQPVHYTRQRPFAHIPGLDDITDQTWTTIDHRYSHHLAASIDLLACGAEASTITAHLPPNSNHIVLEEMYPRSPTEVLHASGMNPADGFMEIETRICHTSPDRDTVTTLAIRSRLAPYSSFAHWIPTVGT